jgi:hypothetical protein
MTTTKQDNTMPVGYPKGTHIAATFRKDSHTYFYKRVPHTENLYVFTSNKKWEISGFTGLSTLLRYIKKVVWVTDNLTPLVEAWYQAQTKDSPVVEKPSLPEPAKPVKGSKFDSGKPRFSLLPHNTLSPVLRVLEAGAVKYSVNNWQHVENPRERYYDAAVRHLYAWFHGEPKDLETGESHLAHAICCLLFLLWFESN